MTKYFAFVSGTEREPPTSASEIPLIVMRCLTCSIPAEYVLSPISISNGDGSSGNGSPRSPNFFTGRSKHFACSTGAALRSHRPGTARKRLQTSCAATALAKPRTNTRLLRINFITLYYVDASLECADLSALWPKRCQGTALQSHGNAVNPFSGLL